MTGSSSNSSSTSAGVVTPSLSGFLFIKLDKTNYPLWLAQISPMLRSKSLMGFVDGTNMCPSKFKKDISGKDTQEVNPDYVAWQEKDQMVLSWINNSLTPQVLATVARFTTSHETWKSLEKRYASQSQNRIMHLRHKLFSIKGDGLSISEFVDKVNNIADNLALAGKPVDDGDLTSIIMNNVGATYESTVSSTQARDSPISLDDLIALLLEAEMRLKAQNTPALETTPTAMFSPKTQFKGNRGRGFVNNHVPFRGRGRGRGSSFPAPNFESSTPVCQICSHPRHTAIDCYERMNQAFEGRVPTQKLKAMAASAPYANNHAMFPTSSNSKPTPWITDTGASNHITPDIGNLALHDEYRGRDQVAVGNGTVAKFGEDTFPWKE